MARTWFITGCSSGFGKAITKAALGVGDNVIATSRDASKLADLAQSGVYTVSLDVNSSQKDIDAVVADAVNKYGSIDILVNNAGYILEGGIEEVSDEEARDHFNTNVFGQLAVTRAVLPYMRAKKSGVIANMGSIAGWRGGINCGMYCSTKFALIGITEALKKEVEPLGITVVAIEPGYFRTDFLSGGHKVSPKNSIPDLEPVIKPFKDMFSMYDHQQPGDPTKGAQLIVEALTGTGRCAGKKLPARLAIGSDAIAMITEVLEDKKKELDEWKDLAVTTDIAA
ncbi:hypothetical protein BGW36DRAFT_353156 [Talaromyces proteolyticus]|uniref:Uncharacterized protein n=1 Tax=Talaromyces proteolyticus TaxID=1131652 RepID=A0AAD4L146_9EURO|nr:uncharacterized protein BGW36DRAFT_353156 [Talaromyces proteolyticus]KAH8704706.1 hypothetical protein BGW36DRAFT_353156 [Talaromyces proteolyticus]